MFIDLHCDTASRMYYEKGKLKMNDFSIDIDKLRSGNALCQFFAFYIDLKGVNSPFEEFMQMYNNFMSEIEFNKDEISIIKSFKNIEELKNSKKLGAVLTIEEGEVLEGDIKNLEKVYNLGVRAITLTWNYENSIGYPNINFKHKDKGLTEKGRHFVYEMEKFGIIPDCSHLSDKGFYDLVDICKKPFVATHSNSRIITEHPRNLTDDMIKKLSNKGGVMGLNFCSSFIGKSEIAEVKDMVKHINHIKNIGGVEVIALGSDFDGIGNKVEIENSSEFYKLERALKINNFNEDEIEKIFYKNVLRVLKECL